MTAKKECCCNAETCEPCIQGATITDQAGCCHSPSESLVLEIPRPGLVSYSSNCCPLSPPEGVYDCALFCCKTTEYSAPTFRSLYTYRDEYFLVNTAAITEYTPFGIQCSACDESATADDCCGVGLPPYANCACDPNGNNGHNLSPWQRSWMEDNASHWWLLDILCHAGGDNVLCPAWQPDPLCEFVELEGTETLYKHLLAVVHRENWWTFDTCPDNPSPPLTIPNTPDELSPQCVVPEHFIYACSGVPLFDFDLDDAVDTDVITAGERCELVQALATGNNPPQGVLKKLYTAGYLKAKDWREEARQELIELKALFPTAYAGCTIPECEDMPYLGPVRKRYLQYCDGVWKGLFPSDARVPELQLDSACLADPWSGVYPEPGDDDYDDFLFWKDRQWVYFHARPGGWDWVCWDVGPETDFPNVARRDSDACGGDCLDVSGYPRDFVTQNCPPGEGANETCEDCTNIVVRSCGQASICPEVGCADQDYCAAFPENGGGNSTCLPVMIGASCDGLHFVYGRVEFDDSGPLSDCAGVGWRYVPKCTILNQAYLYGIGRNCGSWDGVCPHECQRVNKIAISNVLPNVEDSLIAYRSICAAINQGCTEAQECCGTFCLPFENESETLDPCCEGHIVKPACEPDSPSETDHPCL